MQIINIPSDNFSGNLKTQTVKNSSNSYFTKTRYSDYFEVSALRHE